MSDFLKNIRNNQSRYQQGRSRGSSSFDNRYYPSQDRRAGNDRRTSGNVKIADLEPLIKYLEELLPKISVAIEESSDNRVTQIELQERQLKIQEDLAASFKSIASSIGGFDSAPSTVSKPKKNDSKDDPGKISVTNLSAEDLKSPADERKAILNIIKKLRKKGGTYKEIAVFLNAKSIPTFSNKGNWHAQTIHRLCNQ